MYSSSIYWGYLVRLAPLLAAGTALGRITWGKMAQESHWWNGQKKCAVGSISPWHLGRDLIWPRRQVYTGTLSWWITKSLGLHCLPTHPTGERRCHTLSENTFQRVVQCLSVKTRVRPLIQEDPTCYRATKPVRVPQLLGLRSAEALVPRSPRSATREKPVHQGRRSTAKNKSTRLYTAQQKGGARKLSKFPTQSYKRFRIF